MFPQDAITIRQEISGAGNIILASSTRTILDVSLQKATANKTNSVLCGSNTIISNYSTNVQFDVPMQYICYGEITLNATSNGLASFIITYVPRDISLNGSTTPLFYGGFSYGDILTIMLLLFIFTISWIDKIKKWVFGEKIEGIVRVVSEKSSRL